MRNRLTAGVCAIALMAGSAAAQSLVGDKPAANPRQVLAAAKTALGAGDAMAAAADIRAELSGQTYAGEQGHDPADLLTTTTRTYRWWFDGDGGRAARESEQVYPGGIRFFTSAAVTPTGGWSVDVVRWRTGTDLEVVGAPEAKAELSRWERTFPHLVLRQAEAAGASLRPTAEGGLSFTDAVGEQVDLSFDPATKLMTTASVMKDGVAQTTTVYGDYARTNGVMLPRTVQQRFAGQLREDLRLGATQFGEAPMQRFIAPAGYVTAPAAGVPTARALAPEAWIFENMPGGYRSMVVDAGDHLVVLEAPLSPAYAEVQKRLIGEIAPGKSVRYVVVTHHHGDHTGGLKTWVEAGATLLAPKGAAVALRRQLVGRGLTRPVSIEEVDERRTLGSGAGRVDLHAFSTSHAKAHLLAYLPSSRLLFQGDMLYVPDRGGPPPAFRVVGDLFEQIRRRRLAVETVVGVHGRPATLAEAERSLERGRREGWGL